MAEGLHLGGGQVLGAFSYTSTGEHGWSVAGRHDLGGLTADAVTEGRGLIERLPWWDDPSRPFQEGIDVYERPRRLAWLARGTAQRRFLIHTVYAERDASNRPGNNFTECLVVARRQDPHGVPADAGRVGGWRRGPDRDDRDGGGVYREDAARLGRDGHGGGEGVEPGHVGVPSGHGHAASEDPSARSERATRPSQLWDPAHWCTPWGAQEVARALPGRQWQHPATPQRDVLRVIAEDATGPVQLRRTFRAVHDTLHSATPARLIAVVDDFIWAGALLDTALSLLPDEDLWDATFDLRSVAPRVTFGTPLTVSLTADLNLFGPEFPPAARVPGTIELTEAAAARGQGSDQRRGPAEPCPSCGQWFATVDAQLGEPDGLDPDRLSATLATVRAAHVRHRQLHPRPDRAPAPDPRRGAGGPEPVSIHPAHPILSTLDGVPAHAPPLSPAPAPAPAPAGPTGHVLPSVAPVPVPPAGLRTSAPGSWAAGTGAGGPRSSDIPARSGEAGVTSERTPRLHGGSRAEQGGNRARPIPAHGAADAAAPARPGGRPPGDAPALSVLARPYLNDPEAAKLRSLIDHVADIVISIEDDPMEDGYRRRKVYAAWREIARAADGELERLKVTMGISPPEGGGGEPRSRSGPKGRK